MRAMSLNRMDFCAPRMKKHGVARMQRSATREPAYPPRSFRATRLHRIRLCKHCNSRRETVVCPLFPISYFLFPRATLLRLPLSISGRFMLV